MVKMPSNIRKKAEKWLECSSQATLGLRVREAGGEGEVSLTGKDPRAGDKFQLTFPLRTNYMYAKAKRSLPEMVSFTACLWIKSNASPGVGTPFSYAVPGQANELVLIEWGNHPMEILINDKVPPHPTPTPEVEIQKEKRGGRRVRDSPAVPAAGGEAPFPHQRRQMASPVHHLDNQGRPVGSLSGRHDAGQRGEPGALPPHQTRGGAGAGPGAGR